MPVLFHDAEQASRLVDAFPSRLNTMLAALVDLREAGKLREAKRMSRRLLRSFSARGAALAFRLRRERRLKGRPFSDDQLREILGGIPMVDPWKIAPERAVGRPQEKLSGTRYTYRLPLHMAAVDYLVFRVLRILTTPDLTEFSSRGGIPAVEAWLRQELPSTALVLTTDIPSCFETMLRSNSELGLPLSRRVRESALHSVKDRAVYLQLSPQGYKKVGWEAVAEVSPPGRACAQGSAVAAVAAENAIRKIIEAIHLAAPGARAGAVGDNLIVLLPHEDQQQSVISALETAVASGFGEEVLGGLTQRTRISRPRGWFSYCGRDYRFRAAGLQRRLGSDRLESFGLRIAVAMTDARSSKSPEDFVRLYRSIMGWVAQNGNLPKVLETAAEALAELHVVWPRDLPFPPTDGDCTSGTSETNLPFVESI